MHKFLKLNIFLVKASEMAVSIMNFAIEDLQIYWHSANEMIKFS